MPSKDKGYLRKAPMIWNDWLTGMTWEEILFICKSSLFMFISTFADQPEFAVEQDRVCISSTSHHEVLRFSLNGYTHTNTLKMEMVS